MVVPTATEDDLFSTEWVEYSYANKKKQTNLTHFVGNMLTTVPMLDYNRDLSTKESKVKISAYKSLT